MKNLEVDSPLNIRDIQVIKKSIINPNQYYTIEKKLDCYLLVFVQQGQLLLKTAATPLTIGAGKFVLCAQEDKLQYTADKEPASLLQISFRAEKESLKDLLAYPFTAELLDIQLLHASYFQTDKMEFIKKSKPSITYDREIGAFFTLAQSTLKNLVTQLLMDLFEQRLCQALPQDFIDQRNQLLEKHHLVDQRAAESLTSIQQTISTRSQNDLVKQIAAFMKNNLDKSYSIEDLSRHFLISSASLKKTFKKETNYSIMHYFKMLKMQQAQVWITEHELTYTEISERLGFNSIHHFSAAFKKHFGCSPSNYYESVKPHDHEHHSQIEFILPKNDKKTFDK